MKYITRQIHKDRPSWMCGEQNVRASARDNTGHTPSPGIEIKIPYPAGNRTRAAGLEGMDYSNHATATDKSEL